MAKRTQKQKQRQRQSLTNIIKIALDRKRSSGRRRSTRQPSQQQTAQVAQQQLLGQLLTSNQPQRLGYSLLERQLQDEKMRNLERMLKDTETRLRPVNPMALPSYSDGSMTGRTARELLQEGGGVKEEEKPMLPQERTKDILAMRQFLIESIDLIEKPKTRAAYTVKDIQGMRDATIQKLYEKTFENLFGEFETGDRKVEELVRDIDGKMKKVFVAGGGRK